MSMFIVIVLMLLLPLEGIFLKKETQAILYVEEEAPPSEEYLKAEEETFERSSSPSLVDQEAVDAAMAEIYRR